MVPTARVFSGPLERGRNRPLFTDDGSARRIAELTAENQLLKDRIQVAEMRYSEEHALRKTTVADMARFRVDAYHHRKKMIDAVSRANEAAAREQNLTRQVQLAERDTRSVSFRNLTLQHQMAQLGDAGPPDHVF